MKLLLFGCDGQVGWELQRALAPLGELVALQRQGANGLSGNLELLGELPNTVRAVSPDIIINAGAYTNVDKAESEPAHAELLNAEAPAVLAQVADEHGATLIHFSTDYVFDGKGDCPRAENAKACPLNVYGATKWQGEEAIRASQCRHLIFRTSWVYSARRTNFVRTMLGLSKERKVLDVVNDQIGAPTGAELIADVTAHAIRVASAKDGLFGTYNIAASGHTTWFEFARFVISSARELGWHAMLSDDGIKPITTKDFGGIAVRPQNSRLDLTKTQATFDLVMPHWTLGVHRVIDEIISERLEVEKL